MINTRIIDAYSHLGNKRTWWLEKNAAIAFESMRNHFQDDYENKNIKLRISDAGRTYEQQAELKKLKPRLAASPGRSWHEAGLAIDVDVVYIKKATGLTQEQLEVFMGQYGWKRTVKKENWHFEYHNIIPRLNVKDAIKHIENDR